jgi:hypothetical protein
MFSAWSAALLRPIDELESGGKLRFSGGRMSRSSETAELFGQTRHDMVGDGGVEMCWTEFVDVARWESSDGLVSGS